MSLNRICRRCLFDRTPSISQTLPLPIQTRSVTTVSNTTTSEPAPEPLANSAKHISSEKTPTQGRILESTYNAPPTSAPPTSKPTDDLPSSSSPLTPNLRSLLPILAAQTPHYITTHIHRRPYLLTQGDTLRLPFLMPGVQPGDVLRLNCATTLGSRDFTLKGGSASASALLAAKASSSSNPDDGVAKSLAEKLGRMTEHEILKHRFGGGKPREGSKQAYIDERLFTCRATVMGVESEPMRVIEKTKRRQRHVKHVRSKHKFTVLRISELRVRSLEEVEKGVEERMPRV